MNNKMSFSWKWVVMLMGFLFFKSNVDGQFATQVGIGALYINGDIDPVFDPMNSFHLGLSKTFKNDFNLELKLGFSKTVGLSGTYMQSGDNGGGLVEDIYTQYNGNSVWYPNHLTTYAYADLGVNYIWQTGLERLRFIGGAGLGISLSNSSVNLYRGEDALLYSIKFDNTVSTEDAKQQLNRLYDETYETNFDEGGGLVPHLSLQLGIQFRLTRGIFLSADVRYHATTSDYLDPLKNISATQESGNNDSVSIFTFGFVGYLLVDEDYEKKTVK